MLPEQRIIRPTIWINSYFAADNLAEWLETAGIERPAQNSIDAYRALLRQFDLPMLREIHSLGVLSEVAESYKREYLFTIGSIFIEKPSWKKPDTFRDAFNGKSLDFSDTQNGVHEIHFVPYGPDEYRHSQAIGSLILGLIDMQRFIEFIQDEPMDIPIAQVYFGLTNPILAYQLQRLFGAHISRSWNMSGIEIDPIETLKNRSNDDMSMAGVELFMTDAELKQLPLAHIEQTIEQKLHRILPGKTIHDLETQCRIEAILSVASFE